MNDNVYPTELFVLRSLMRMKCPPGHIRDEAERLALGLVESGASQATGLRMARQYIRAHRLNHGGTAA